MASIKIEIGGILLFCDESIAKLNIGNGYIIEKMLYEDLFYKDKVKSQDHEFLIDYYDSLLPNDSIDSFMCIRKNDRIEVNVKEEINRLRGIKNPIFFEESLNDYKVQEMEYLNMIFRLIRIFKAGNFGPVDLFFVYDCQPLNILHQKYNVRHIFAGRNVFDERSFSLSLNEQIDCQRFIERYSDGAYDLLKNPINQFILGLERMGEYGGYLEFIIVLEMLLLKSSDGKKQPLANRIAMLLGNSEEEIKKIYDRACKHYENRSKIIHEGDSSGVSLDDRIDLEEMTRRVLKYALERCREKLNENSSLEWAQIKNSMIEDLKSKVTCAKDEGIL